MTAFSSEKPPRVFHGVHPSGPHSLDLDFSDNPEAREPYARYLESGQAWADFGTWHDARPEQEPTIEDKLADAIHQRMCGRMPHCALYKPGSAHRDFYEIRAEAIMAKLEPNIGSANVIMAVGAVLDEVT